MTVSISGLSFSFDSRSEVLKDVSFDANPGELTTIIGANGAGKTTTLKCIAGLYKHQGRILFDGKELGYDDLVERLSYMEQNTDCTINLDVFRIVMLGMIQNLGFKVDKKDIQEVRDTLDLVGIRHLSNRKIGEISGGQRQLVFLAQALVKRPKILLLDEPTGALDLFHQIKLMKLIKQITKDRNCVTIMTLHHLDMAIRFADNVVVMHDKTVYDQGAPSEVFSEEMLHEVYRVKCQILADANGDKFIHILDNEEDDIDSEEVRNV